VQFSIRIGDELNRSSCRRPVDRLEFCSSSNSSSSSIVVVVVVVVVVIVVVVVLIVAVLVVVIVVCCTVVLVSCRRYRAVQFSIRIGDESNRSSCRRPVDRRRDSVIVDYITSDRGDGEGSGSAVAWTALRHLDPFTLSAAAQVVNLQPLSAKTRHTRLRWWQPTLSPGLLFFFNIHQARRHTFPKGEGDSTPPLQPFINPSRCFAGVLGAPPAGSGAECRLRAHCYAFLA